MAGGAICAKRPNVKSRVGMTVDARSGCPCELAVDVAFFAVNLLVRARQWEVTARVVERGVIPSAWRVTRRTVCAEIPVMLVILLVAGIAVLRRAFENAVLMTLLAFNVCMFTFKFKG